MLYAALGIYWTAGGDGFPFARVDDAHATGSILEGTPVEIGGPVMIVAGTLGLAVALAMAFRRGVDRRWSAVLVVFGATVAVALTLVIPDYTLLALVAFAPFLIVFAFTGVPGGGGVGDILYWHRTDLIILFVGGLVWAAATLTFHRERRGACVHCGRRHASDGDQPSQQTLLRWGRAAVAVALVAPLPYEVTRIAWFLGFPLGISPDFLRMMQDTTGMLSIGLGLAVASIGGGVLTRGLVSRWGEVFPRWLGFVAGRPVPVALAVVPASIVSVILVPAGLMPLWTPAVRESWALWVPSLFWVLWAAALGTATFAYYLRRRGVCRYCGAGVADASAVTMDR